jgi:hypothetical protein
VDVAAYAVVAYSSTKRTTQPHDEAHGCFWKSSVTYAPSVPGRGAAFTGSNTCLCTWAELTRSAVSVGKLKRDLRRYGIYSKYEAVYRAHIIRANLQRISSGDLIQSDAFKALDPSEKGAISYFLGISIAKLFAERLLDVPWLMHLDVYKKLLRPTLTKGRAKPDLVGENSAGEWIVIEAKGRTHGIEKGLMTKAKKQAKKLRKVKSTSVSLKVALAAHFEAGSLSVDWRDPEETDEEPHDLGLSHDVFIRDYYEPFLSILASGEPSRRETEQDKFRAVSLFDGDITIGLSEQVINYLESQQYRQIFEYSLQHEPRTIENISTGRDGVFVELAESWTTDDEANKTQEEDNVAERRRSGARENQHRHT